MKCDKHEEIEEDSECMSSSSEDDENAELLTEELEEGFLKVLSQLKKKDPKLYDESITYFPKEESEILNSSKKKQLERYKKWLKGQIKEVEDDEVKKDLKALHDVWASPCIKQEDKFLRDYILNKKFLERDDNFSIKKELEKLTEEEKELEEQTIFEQKYNCRFENPDEEFLQKYPNTMKRAYGNNWVVSTSDNFIVTSENSENSIKKNLELKKGRRNTNNLIEKPDEMPIQREPIHFETGVKFKRRPKKSNNKRKGEVVSETAKKIIKEDSKFKQEEKSKYETKSNEINTKPELEAKKNIFVHSKNSKVNNSNNLEQKGKVTNNIKQNFKIESKNDSNMKINEASVLMNLSGDLNKKAKKERHRRSKSPKNVTSLELAIKKGESNIELSESSLRLTKAVGQESPIGYPQEVNMKQGKEKQWRTQYHKKFEGNKIKKTVKKLKGIQTKDRATFDKPKNLSSDLATRKVKKKPRHRASLKNNSVTGNVAQVE